MSTHRRVALRLASEDMKTHKHSLNPFTAGWRPETTTREKRFDLAKRPAITDGEGNRVSGVLLIPIERESSRFTKLFHDEMGPLYDLSVTAHKVLAFAMQQALPNNAVVWLPPDAALTVCGFRQPKSFYDGVAELILYDYLARSEKRGFYFLNPRRFVTGRRSNLKNSFIKPKGQ